MLYRVISFSITHLMLLISSLILLCCNSTASSSNPLKDIEKYQVTLFVSPYGDLSEENIQKLLKEKLASLGQVVEKKIPISEEIPMLFVSLEPKGSAIPSTIQVFEKVKVLKNGCKLTSVIWSHSFRTERASIPIEREDKVSFAQKDNPSVFQEDPLDSLLNAFVEEYKVANPKRAPITFLISQ